MVFKRGTFEVVAFLFDDQTFQFELRVPDEGIVSVYYDKYDMKSYFRSITESVFQCFLRRLPHTMEACRSKRGKWRLTKRGEKRWLSGVFDDYWDSVHHGHLFPLNRKLANCN